MVVFGLWVINKAGGLVYQRNFADGLAQLSSNEYLVLAGTLHGIHAITSRLSPTGSSSGAQVIEAETFKMTILLTATGTTYLLIVTHVYSTEQNAGTKFVLLTSLHDANAEALLQKVYEAYADMGMKNPFHTPEMPIRSDRFDLRIGVLLGTISAPT
ncbi:hypothetical protein EW145_g297 [Phellinidium pouzarii]|uniref:Trafficking protein particle complex subunit n=1 Tax=Phellinidium pouzarii TaxID=167371 RepID=A0A4S4LKU0_9AGAM|nr:hypothetical protein EW145_g297 [Phellinidium pouzarii]